jgi:hypothetical protein
MVKVVLKESVDCLRCGEQCFVVPEKNYYRCCKCAKNVFPRDFLTTYLYLLKDESENHLKVGLTTQFEAVFNMVGYWQFDNFLVASDIQRKLNRTSDLFCSTNSNGKNQKVIDVSKFETIKYIMFNLTGCVIQER